MPLLKPKKVEPKIEPRIIRFAVPKIMCSSCSQIIKSLLTTKHPSLPKLRAYVDWPKKQVVVTLLEETTLSDKEILTIIKDELSTVDFFVEHETPITNYLIKGTLGTILGLVILLLCATGAAIPMIAMYVLGGISTLVTLYLGFNIYRSAALTFIKTRKLTMDSLFTISTLTATVASLISFAVPGLPMLFDVPLMILGIRYYGIAIEEISRRKIIKGVVFRDRIPKMIEIAKKDAMGNIERYPDRRKIAVASLEVGDVIFVPRNEIIPVDGECLDEKSYVCKNIHNGELIREKIVKGDLVLGGMPVGNNVEFLTLKVTATESCSYPARIDKRMDKANEESQLEETANKILRYFIPVVIGISIVSFIVLSIFFPITLAVQAFIAVLVTACPCGLGLTLPYFLEVGRKKGRENNIEFKNGDAIKSASEVNAVVFDLNGTLTKGKKKVVDFILVDETLNEEDKEAFLEKLYLLEKTREEDHMVAKAIVDYTKKLKPTMEECLIPIIDCTSPNDPGVRAEIDKEIWTVGNETMMLNYHIDLSNAPKSNLKSDHMIYLAKGSELIGALTIKDPIRKEAPPVIEHLQNSGIKTFICSGSSWAVVKAYIEKHQLPIPDENIFSDCVPAEEDTQAKDNIPKNKRKSKTQIIQSLQTEGYKVAFIGDGGNDAPVLQECDCGIFVPSQVFDEAAADNAKVLIEGNSLLPIINTFSIAKQTLTAIRISLGISFTYNVATLLIASGLLIGLGFTLNPAIGAALMVLQLCLILAGAYYFKCKSLPPLPKDVTSFKEEPRPCSTGSLLQNGLKPAPREEFHPQPTLRTRWQNISGRITGFLGGNPLQKKPSEPVKIDVRKSIGIGGP